MPILTDLIVKFYIKWHWPTCFKFVRNWRERFDQANVQGAPLTHDKVKHFIKTKHSPFWKVLHKLVFCHPRKQQAFALSPIIIGIGNTSMRMSLARVRPMVPSKKYLIALPDVPQSCWAASQCISSAESFGESKNIEIFPGIDKHQVKDFFVRHDLSWVGRNRGGGVSIREAVQGCFASHYSLWLKCMELNEPIIILEHDAVFVSKIPALRFKHIAMLAYSPDWPSTEGLYAVKENTESYYPFSYMRGLGAYAVTPSGACILVENAQRGVTFAADNFVRRGIVSIVDFRPAPFNQLTYFSLLSEESSMPND